MKTKLSELLSRITQLPWKISDTSIINEEYCIAVIQDDGEYASPPEEREANKIYIPHAANVLPGLVAASRNMLDHARSGEVTDRDIDWLMDELGKAEEVNDETIK